MLWFLLLIFLRVICLLLHLQSLPTARHWQASWRITFKKVCRGKASHQAKTENCSLPAQAKPKHTAEICLLFCCVCSNEWNHSHCSLHSITHRCECESVILTTSVSGLSQHSCRLFLALPWESPAFSFRFTQCLVFVYWLFYNGSNMAHPFIFIMYCCFEFLECCIMFLLHHCWLVLWFMNRLIFWFASIKF